MSLVRYGVVVSSMAPSMPCCRGSGPSEAISSSLMPEVRKRRKPPSPSGSPSAAYRAPASSRELSTSRCRTSSTDTSAATASTASLTALRVGLRRSAIAVDDSPLARLAACESSRACETVSVTIDIDMRPQALNASSINSGKGKRSCAPRQADRPRSSSQPSKSPVKVILPRIPTAFWIIDRDLRITTAYGPGFDSLSLHPELDTVVGLDLFEYFKTDDPEFESIANHLIALTGQDGRLQEQAARPGGRGPAGAAPQSG